MIRERAIEFVRAVGKNRQAPHWTYGDEGEAWHWRTGGYYISIWGDEKDPGWFVVFDLDKMKEVNKNYGLLKEFDEPKDLADYIEEMIQEAGL